MPIVTPIPAENLLKTVIKGQFSTRPALRSVVAEMLARTLKEHYPPLSIAPSDLYMALPREGGGRALRPLLDVALQFLADGHFPDLSLSYGLDAYLSDATGSRLTFQADGERSYDLNVFENAIRELPLILFVGAQEALAAYWEQDSDTGVSRWQWLAEVLRGAFRASAVRQSGDDTQQLQILSTLADYPSRETRTEQPWPANAIHAYTLETQLVQGSTSLTQQASDILLVSGTRVLLCGLSGRIDSYASLDAFGEAWGKHIQAEEMADTITWRLYEPDGDIFEVQAALVLDRQLENLASLRLPAGTSVKALEQQFAAITDLASLFTDSPAIASHPAPAIEAALPGWLQNASAADRFAFSQCLLEQASLRRLNQGKHYLDDLEDIRSYAASHLDHQLCLDRNATEHGERSCKELAQGAYRADALQLTFEVPVGTLQSGYIDRVSMSLVDLALKNLSGKPAGRMTVRHADGQPVDSSLTPEYLLALVQRIDVGRNYPAYLHQSLLGEDAQAQERKRLFLVQRPIDLKTQALEYKIKGQAGLTSRGLRYVEAVLGTHSTERWAGMDEVVMRVLAFQRKPGAKADGVQNMFIIEPRNGQPGPRLLYRPAYRDSLLEFTDRASLLAAIAEPGELQDSVLAWMEDPARAVYSNGGFREPHYVRVSGIGSEFDPLPPIPRPATLAPPSDESSDQILQALGNNQLMDYLYECEARQLQEQADRDSTSNTESRWALILEGVRLGFNTLLMLVRGPLAAVGWFMQLALSLKQDIPALESQDPIARELAWVDLLLNTSMVLIHLGIPDHVAQPPTQAEVPRLPWQHPQGQAISTPAVVQRGIIGLPAEPPGGGRTLLDIDRSLASDRAATRLLRKLLEVNVPWPEHAPDPVALGPYRGLFKIGQRWHATVGGLLFRVNITPDVDDVFIIDPNKPDHPGIKLRTDGKGHWTLDRGLKLAGGGPKRLATLREENRRQAVQLKDRMDTLNAQISPDMAEFRDWLTRLNNNRAVLIKQTTTLKLVWNLLQKATDAQRPAIEARHQQEIAAYSKARTDYEVVLDKLEQSYAKVLPKRIELYKVGQDLQKYAGAGPHVQDQAITLKTLWDEQMRTHFHLQKWADTFMFTERGEPMSHLASRMREELREGRPWAYNEHVTRSIELADVVQRMAARSREMETTLELLEQDSVAGRVLRTQALSKITTFQHFFAQNLEMHALIPLSWVVVKLSALEASPLEALYIDHLNNSSLGQALLSHTEVRSSSGYPLDEQRLLYGTILDKYRSYEQAIEALTFINPQRVHPVAERLLAGLSRARTLAENELESVVRSQEALEVEASAATLLRPKEPAKRIFKTRTRTYWIGELKPVDGLHPRERLTITNSLTGEPLTTFDADDAGSWVETPQQPMAAPEPAAPASTLAMLKDQGEKVLRQRPEIERLISAQQKKLESALTRQDVNPADWDELLTGQADRLNALADEIARDHSDQPRAQDAIDRYRANARDMQRMATRLCSDAYKRQWPTLESLDYLWRHKEIDINLTSLADPQRPTLSGDFFTEYAVYDKAQKPPSVLWYAHFHYATADAPPERYTRAHLKLASQRKYTQKDLLKEHVQAKLRSEQAAGADPVERILYVLIAPPQDQLFLAIAPTIN